MIKTETSLDRKNNMNEKAAKISSTIDTINILFDLIRSHEWNEFNKVLDADDTVDINVRDSQFNYLLTYATRFNKLDIVRKLLKRGAKYDIVDRHERSIIYDALESDFVDIIIEFLECSKNNVGVSVTDIRDLNGNIPLHYAIRLKQPKNVKLLIDYKSNPYTIDLDGYNSLHLATRSGSSEIVKHITAVMSNLNAKTLKGETSLHIAINYHHTEIAKILLDEGADPNITDSENEFSPLHYAVGWNNDTVVKYLLNANADANVQDIYGNVPLVYCIKEDHTQCFDTIVNHSDKNGPIKLNYNLLNIDGKTILHEILENYTDTKKHYVDKVIKYSGLNSQDSRGNTCMHYLIALGMWKEYKDIIKTKKINIFAKNSSGNAVIDLIYVDKKEKPDKEKMNDYHEFLDLITESYISILKREKRNWRNELDRICSRDLTELSEKEKNFVTDNISENDFQKGCTLLIRNKIVSDIKLYREKKLEFCQRSYPTDEQQCIDVKEGFLLDVCTFTGSLLDVLIGLMFLLKKHPNACTTLGKNHSPSEELCNFYKSMGLIMNGRCEFINFEIVWIDYKLYMIDNFSELFNACIRSKAKFVIIPLGIEMRTDSHANYLIYDKHVKELERFEPHGGTTPIGFNYNSKFLDDVLEDYFKSIDKDIHYIRPQEYIPKIGFQLMDSQEERRKRIGDPGGFCALWSIWYVDQRLTYYTYDRKTLIEALFENINAQGISYRNMIRNYSKNIINERDKLLKTIDVDINDWLNDNYTYAQLDKFIATLSSEINTCCTAKQNK
jgi:ankyrin repeat protein